MLNWILLTFWTFLLAFSSFGQEATVKGVVLGENDAPLEGANVIYRYDVSRGAQTDKNGNFSLSIPAGKALLIVRYTGMRSDTLVFNLSENEVKSVSIKLKPYSIEKGQVTVSVGKFDKPLEEQTVTMVVMKPTMIENKN
ncbi:MAG: hypothetical protein RL110_10, partial [Bacteroidota bacterium]